MELLEEGAGLEADLGVLFLCEKAVDAINVPVDSILANLVVIDTRE